MKAERSVVITFVASLTLVWALLAGCLAQEQGTVGPHPGRPSIPASHAEGSSGTVEPVTSLASCPGKLRPTSR